MTTEIFFDSSAFFACADQSSNEGKEINNFLLQNRPTLVTTNLVFAETVSLITKRINKSIGIKFGEEIRTSRILRMTSVDETLQQESWNFYKKYKDKNFDFIDATSFVFCHKNGIKEAITLDHHFAQMGLKVYP